MTDKVVVIYASCGAGHKTCAYAIGEILKCPIYDILDFTLPLIKKLCSNGYRVIIERIPVVWALLFEITKIKIVRCLVEKICLLSFLKLTEFLKSKYPEVLIFTHFFPLSLLPVLKKKVGSKIKIIVVITDLGVHPLWVNKEVNVYLVALRETKVALIREGISESKIIEEGIPLREGFYQENSLEALRKKFAISERPSLLFLSSEIGKIPFFKQVIPSIKNDFNIFVIYGRNKKLKRYLERLSCPYLRFFPFYENIWEIMKICMAIVGKPGGLTSFEAVSLGKPLIITYYIYGQEKLNRDILVKLKLGFWVKNAEQLRRVIFYIKDNLRETEKKFVFKGKDVRDTLRKIVAK